MHARTWHWHSSARASHSVSAGGMWGMGERGVGGSKCGATAAVACLYQRADGSTTLLAANVGDSRVLLIRDGKAVQLTTGVQASLLLVCCGD